MTFDEIIITPRRTVCTVDVVGIIKRHILDCVIDGTKYEAALELYSLLDDIEGMPDREARWLIASNGALKCSHCGYSFFNGTDDFVTHCSGCGYRMV